MLIIAYNVYITVNLSTNPFKVPFIILSYQGLTTSSNGAHALGPIFREPSAPHLEICEKYTLKKLFVNTALN